MRLAALAWLLVLAPVELATTLTALLTGPGAAPGVAVLGLVLCRVLIVAAGLMLGQRLLRRDEETRGFACAWASADLGTLAIVLASGGLPTSRRPGDAPLVWLVYAAGALLVVVASSARPAAKPVGPRSGP